MRPLRVLHFADCSDTSGYFPQLARWRDGSRFDMVFGTLRDTEERVAALMQQHGVKSVSCRAKRRLGYPLAVVRLVRILRSERIDVLHTHLFDPSVVGLVAGRLARTRLCVQTRHYSDYHTRIGRRWHTQLDRLCARLSRSVIAVSQHTADHMIRNEHVAADKVEVILNGIDFDRVRISGPEAPQRLRTAFAPPGGALVFTAGRLHPEKGYEFLFEAIAAIIRRVQKPLRLLVAGTGPYERVYREQVRRLGLSEHVVFLGFRKDVPDLLAAADLFVLASVAEAFGLVVAEALYIGSPIVATRCGGIPEIVDDGRDGILVPPADHRALAEAVEALLTDEGRRASFVGVGREKIRQRFSFERMMRAYEALYDRLLVT